MLPQDGHNRKNNGYDGHNLDQIDLPSEDQKRTDRRIDDSGRVLDWPDSHHLAPFIGHLQGHEGYQRKEQIPVEIRRGEIGRNRKS